MAKKCGCGDPRFPPYQDKKNCPVDDPEKRELLLTEVGHGDKGMQYVLTFYLSVSSKWAADNFRTDKYLPKHSIRPAKNVFHSRSLHQRRDRLRCSTLRRAQLQLQATLYPGCLFCQLLGQSLASSSWRPIRLSRRSSTPPVHVVQTGTRSHDRSLLRAVELRVLDGERGLWNVQPAVRFRWSIGTMDGSFGYHHHGGR